jgi:enoyl-CoA hydratase/carnithine racemase
MVLLTDRSDHVWTLRVNRPETRNAVNFALMDALEEQISAAEQDESLRVFVLTGSDASNAFISGGDLREFHQIKRADEAREMSLRMIRLLDRIRALPCWTLAAVNGAAYGGGWEIMLAFDLRIASEEAIFGFTQGKFYLPPGWGGLASLQSAVGTQRAAFLLASQAILSAPQAHQAGLIHDYYPTSDYAQQLARLTERLALNDRTYIRYIKEQLFANDVASAKATVSAKATTNTMATTNTHDLAKAKSEAEPFSRFWESEEHMRRVEDFLKKRSG